MSRRGDDQDVDPRPVDRRTADALLSGRAVDGEPELSAFVRDLRAAGTGPAPAPSVALYGLLSEGFTPEPDAHVVRAVSWTRRATRSTTWVRGAVALGVATLALTGGAAANALPRPVQDAVADVVEAVTPITVPRPAAPVPADDRGRSEDVRQDGTGTDDTLQRDVEHEGNGGGGRSQSGDRRGDDDTRGQDRSGKGKDDAPGQDRSGKGEESGKGSSNSSGSGSSGSGSGKDDSTSGSGRSGSGSSSDDRPTAAPAEQGDDHSGSGKDQPPTPAPVRTSVGDDELSGSGGDDHSGSGKADSAKD